jgi:hypothetical protein
MLSTLDVTVGLLFVSGFSLFLWAMLFQFRFSYLLIKKAPSATVSSYYKRARPKVIVLSFLAGIIMVLAMALQGGIDLSDSFFLSLLLCCPTLAAIGALLSLWLPKMHFRLMVKD